MSQILQPCIFLISDVLNRVQKKVHVAENLEVEKAKAVAILANI